MTNFKTTRILRLSGYLLALLTTLALPRTASAQTSVSKIQPARPQNAVKYGSYGSYFESNQSGLKSRNSYLIFTDRRAFNRTFGAAAVMGSNKFLLDNAFETGMVVAVIKRGPVIWNYKVEKVVAKGRSLAVHYSAKAIATENSSGESADASPANFASPLIVAVEKKENVTVFFIENGKTVGKTVVQAPKTVAPQTKTGAKTQITPKISVAPPSHSAPLVRPIIVPTPSANAGATGDQFFEGTYRVGAINCQVTPIKMAFEVKWAGRSKSQLFFADFPAGQKANQKPTYRAEESSGNARFVFDNSRFESGKFVRADGKVLAVRKVSKPRGATRQVFVYLVVVGDGGKSGKKFGCDDSLVALRRSVPTIESPLMSALQELISLPPQYPGNVRLQNFWKGRNLKIQTVSVRGGIARIQIAGEVFVAGVCDEPRIITQIEATARQFPSVKRVKVFINGQALRNAIQ